MSQLQETKYIECPHCKWQYLPGEILMPRSVLGQPAPDSVIRDPLGKILYYEWKDEPLAEEDYICDNCGKQFTVSVSTDYKAKTAPVETDFTSEYVSLL